MTTTKHPTVWWQTAPNPPCQPWCTTDHADEEFTWGAGFLCRREVGRMTVEAEEGIAPQHAEVELCQYQGGDTEPGAVTTYPPEIYFRFSSSDMSLPFEKARDLAQWLNIRSAQAQAIAEGKA